MKNLSQWICNLKGNYRISDYLWFLYPIAVLIVAITMVELAPKPVEPVIVLALAYLEYSLYILPLFAVALLGIFSTQHHVGLLLGTACKQFIYAYALYALSFYLLASHGDAMHQMAVNDPLKAIAIGITLVLLLPHVLAFVLIVFATTGAGRSNANSVDTSYGIAASSVSTPISPRDEAIIKLHEAGHAVFYGLLSEIPSDVTITLNTTPNAGQPPGRITDIDTQHHLMDSELCEWKMLMLLGGQRAEHLFAGMQSLGSHSDKLRWQYLAKHYLGGLFEHSQFIVSPQRPEEYKINADLVDELYQEQLARVDEFLKLNQATVHAISNELDALHNMDATRLANVCDALVIPDTLPRPQIGSQPDSPSPTMTTQGAT
ncbi:hypothetical protein [Alteromonas macleodii]|uniref:Peptidase M41 family protein n=1 Tax=Alteromonas macleodii TaxID=28108 RepID=A0AB36FNA8_ALTMA|nr:hypothetical protein [Alteromonas macleodii]OES23928.1 peptidase M41 family protein [Alteromonas macleodii]OES24106.1 peptidase M41 family protein [Alteromonas macleodii]OES25033.1 peptidase M41 family protein [Alteromonas macleodii]OES38699.1 peptidase M41 family protein [Alteromonas macleodii]